jgi:hypothetical protein
LTRWALVVIIVTIAGCAASAPSPRPSALILARADRLVAQGQHAGALEAYEEILAKYPHTDEAGRARSSRDTLGHLLAARAQIVKLTGEMKAQEAQMRAQEVQMKSQDAELARARQEIARLTAEADRLRADLENLKKIDIDLERRRK